MRKTILFAFLIAATTGASAQSSPNNQSQTSRQNNGSTYQTSYQVNASNGAGQGQGTGSSQAQADYNASAAIRQAPAYPQGSQQTQSQSLNYGSSTQNQSTRPGGQSTNSCANGCGVTPQ